MIFNCKNLAKEIVNNLNLVGLSLGVIQIGDDPVSRVFMERKKEVLEKAGGFCNLYHFPATISFNDLKDNIENFPDDGLIIQLPIKGNFDTQRALNLVPFKKDVDVLSEISLGKFYTGNLDILPPVIGAIDAILKKHSLSLKGKTVAIIGPGRLVGKPMVVYSLLQGATVILIGPETKTPAKFIKRAEVVVSGVGKPGLIKATAIKEGAIVLDAGTTKKNKKIKGDVLTDEVAQKAVVTPVPGGIGPLTIAMLVKNLAKRHAS